VAGTITRTSKDERRELMAKRRRFLRAVFGGIVTVVALPFSRVRSEEEEPGISLAEGDSVGVQDQDSSQVQAADSSTAPQPEGRSIEIPLDQVKDLRKVGGSTILKIDGRRILVVRESEESVRAFQSECTHKNATLKYDKKKRILRCPAHGSWFDLDGTVVRGPAEHPLPTLRAELREEHIVLVIDE
jgi:Rieske Fe-S protein